MPTTPMDLAETSPQHTGALDAIIVGTGFSGFYQLHALRDRLGLKRRRSRR